jgi:cation/acetate symporter
MAITIFLFFVAVVLGISFFLGAKAKSAQGFFAAGGGVPWWVNGLAFAGDYLSAASFLGICGMIAFYGYDGFLYSIGYLAGWIVALFVIAEPLKRLGRFTFADALDSQFNSRGIKFAAAISTLVVSIFYLIPQMVGAGALIKPLLGWDHWMGVTAVGGVVIVIVATAGMVSTTWVQFIKGGLLVLLCTLMTGMILNRGLTTKIPEGAHVFRTVPASEITGIAGVEILPDSDGWKDKAYVRVKSADGSVAIWRKAGPKGHEGDVLSETQSVIVTADKKTLINGKEGGALLPVGHVAKLPDGKESTGALDPLEFLRVFQDSDIVQWKKEQWKKEPDATGANGESTTVYYQQISTGASLLTAGGSATFSGLRSDSTVAKIDFLSLMLALFLGTASLPHILIRYYTVKDQVSARKSTILGIASIGFFYVLTLYLGLGAMTSGALPVDPTGSNMAAPLLAKSFNELLFAIISAVAFTTVLGTVSGLIMAASGAVAHDLATNLFKLNMNEERQVRVAKLSAVVVGLIAIALGIVFKDLNATFLVAWAFNIAASANLPALVMLLFWKGTTKQGITWAIMVGMIASLGWVLGSKEAMEFVYHYPKIEAATKAIVPFSQPAIITVPLGFLVLIVVSLLTRNTGTAKVLAKK